MASKLTINIDVTYMKHSGGTKFYQVFELRANGRVATVCHWGKIVGRGSFPKPVNGGQTQVFTRPEMRQKIEEKRKRGYTVHDENTIAYDCGLEINHEGTFRRLDSDWMVEHFGMMLAHEVYATLMLPKTTAEPAPKDAPDTSFMGAKPVIEKRPEAWGSW